MQPRSAAYSGDELIQLAYEALERPDAWQELLDGIVAATGRTQGLLSVIYPGRSEYSFQVSIGAPPEALREYAERWHGEDIWATRVDPFQVPVGKILLSQDICPDEILEASDYYREFLARYRWHYGAGVRLSGQAHQMAVLTVNGPKESGPLKSHHVDVLNRLLPHLCRAVRVHEAMADLRQQSAAAIHAASRPDDGVALTTSEGRLLYGNAAVSRILEEADGLRYRGTALSACHPEDQEDIQAALREVTEARRGPNPAPIRLSIRRQSGGAPYLVFVQAGTPASTPPMSLALPTALVTLIDPARDSTAVDTAMLRQAYHLSGSEARLAAQLVAGLTPKDAAEASGVAISTIRTQLRSLFAKTGCSRQSEVVKLALRMAGHKS
ncbi:MAG: helix-turn-helix transcriptional regulator [Bryobacterales bacterium]|nr:helix-turn-helix transcriptional regulator [Bryobacterales bacterium]